MRRRISCNPDQFSLDFGASPPDNARIFFAASPDHPAASTMTMIARHLRAKYRLTGKPRPLECLHASLRGVGGYDPQLIERVMNAAATVAMPPFKACFNRAVTFEAGEKKPVVLVGDAEGVDGFSMLRDMLDRAMIAAGFSRQEASFNPHITLLYDRQSIAAERIEPISWTVRGFNLIHSAVGETRHTHLGSWPLRG